MTILVLASMPPEDPGDDRTRAEFDLYHAAQAISEALPNSHVESVRGDPGEMFKLLERLRPAAVFNLCEAPLGRPDREAHVAALLEWLEIPFTGNRSDTLMLCRRKDLAKAALRAAGVATPRENVFPCIVKPVDQDGSVGINLNSICRDRASMEMAVSRLKCPALVEEYLPGREFTVALWGHTRAEHVVLTERCFAGDMRIMTYRAKWEPGTYDFENVEFQLDPVLEADRFEAISTTARTAWEAVGGRGYMRVDVRLDASAVPRVIDVNPNPHLGPPGGMHDAATHAGWTWERFVRQQIEWA